MSKKNIPENEIKESGDTQNNTYKTIAVVVAIIALIAIMVLFYSQKEDLPFLESIGNAAGFIQAIISGLAFIALIYTITQQRDQIKLQSEDLKLQRKELHNQYDEMKHHTNAFCKQIEESKEQKWIMEKTILETRRQNYESNIINMIDSFLRIKQDFLYSGARGNASINKYANYISNKEKIYGDDECKIGSDLSEQVNYFNFLISIIEYLQENYPVANEELGEEAKIYNRENGPSYHLLPVIFGTLTDYDRYLILRYYKSNLITTIQKATLEGVPYLLKVNHLPK